MIHPIPQTIPADECYGNARDFVACARAHYGQAHSYGPSNRRLRARQLLQAVGCLLEAEQWRDAGRARRRMDQARERTQAWLAGV